MSKQGYKTKKYDYRPQSVLGVANSKFDGDSEQRQYTAKQGERAKGHRPGSTLHQDGDQDWDTDKGNAYQDYGPQQREKKRHGKNDNLKPLDGNMNGYSEARDEYSEKKGERSKKGRPGSTLHQDGDHDWDTDQRKAYQDYGPQKREKHNNVHNDNLKPLDGDMNGHSEAHQEYSEKKGERSKRERPGSTLRQDGDHDWDTDQKNAYRDHGPQQRERHHNERNDTLKPLDGDMNGYSEARQEYSEKKGERSKGGRPGSTLRQDGDHDWDTDQKNAYRDYGPQQREKHKINGDNLRPLDGDHEWDTDKGYRRHSVHRMERHKKGDDTLRPLDGNLESDTENRQQYHSYEDLTRPGRRRPAQGNLSAPGGNFESETENRSRYNDQAGGGERQKPIRGRSTLGQSGEHDWRTQQGTEYQSYDDAGRPERGKRHADNLGLPGGSIDDSTESRSQYEYRRPDRERVFKAHDNLVPNGGALETETETQANFQAKYGRRSGVPYMGKGELALPQGRMDDSTENRSQYARKSGAASRKKDAAVPKSSIGSNRGAKFDGTSEYRQDYKQGFPTERPTKVRVGGSHLHALGGIEGGSEYNDMYQDGGKGLRVDPHKLNEDLLTPYGHQREESRRMGDFVR